MSIEIKAFLAGLLLLNVFVYLTHDSIEYQMQTMQSIPGWMVLVGSFFVVLLLLCVPVYGHMEAGTDD